MLSTCFAQQGNPSEPAEAFFDLSSVRWLNAYPVCRIVGRSIARPQGRAGLVLMQHPHVQHHPEIVATLQKPEPSRLPGSRSIMINAASRFAVPFAWNISESNQSVALLHQHVFHCNSTSTPALALARQHRLRICCSSPLQGSGLEVVCQQPLGLLVIETGALNHAPGRCPPMCYIWAGIRFVRRGRRIQRRGSSGLVPTL